jgi:aryl-alcohol dehydrogenase-like predicted oxidoreductase
MQYRRLGNSQLKVSTVSMGCWAIVGDDTWGAQDEKSALDTIKVAYNNGINFFDTAESYGNGYSEELLGKALKDKRQDVIIASKVKKKNLSAKDLKKSCENSLKRLGTNYLDLYYIHWPNSDVPFAETLGAMEDLKKEGKIRAIGCSNFGKNDFAKLMKKGRVEVNQLPYNLLFRAIESDIIELCRKNNVSITSYSSLAQGLLTGKFKSADLVPNGRARTRHFSSDRSDTRHSGPGFEDLTFKTINKIREISQKMGVGMAELSLAWILQQPGITSVVVGARNPEQITINARASNIKIPEDALKELTNVSNKLKEKLGNNPDMWQTNSRYN